ncbi:nickel ABC transporter substrate-binding protein [Pseudoleptotrichia goodfellowii]|uniref:Nickel ABC transporter, periplasmic nickel-binding protein n=2 Tax=Pseudoleptotrichia goodfellowii TaxID=157692 RepID=D0GLF9_9FUSO|nr:nickel ABC transporter substrate-binding protein [Pseudoleptotrichia goodfellowii]EEY35075.1 nickel ABC transporter, periplasmic nickel-binding protein [Pseudoleptotrichia goodfellowii F0264]
MKKFLKQIGILLMTEIILGCQSKPNSDSKEGQKANKENKVTLAFNQDPVGNLNPHEYLPSQFITQDMVYDGLVSYGENGEIKPMLAESWTISEDGKTYTFKLRPNVKFSDGSAFDAKNVVKNFDTIFSKENKSKHSWFAFTNHLKSYRAVDDLTFEIVLDTPYTATLYDLAMIRLIRFLGDAGFPEGGDTMKGIKAPIGTGAWVLKEHKNNEYAVFVRNEYYWGEKPAASEIIIKNIPDSETLALQFESGDIDLIYGNGLISLDRFNSYRQDNGKYTTATSNPMSTRMLLMNTTSSILGDLNVRKALNHAVDKESIAKNIFDGIEKPADTIFAPNVPHTNVKLEKYGYDLAKAEAMLDEAGWKKGADGIREKNGKKMVLSFPYISSKVTDKSIGEYIQGEWKKIGIQVELKAMEEKAYWQNATAKNYDIMSDFSWGAPWDPHAFLTAMADNSASNTNPDYAAQLGLPMKAQLDKTIKALLVEPNEQKLNEMYTYVLTTLHEQAVYIPISYQAMLSVYRTGELEGVKFMPEENRIPAWSVKKVK